MPKNGYSFFEMIVCLLISSIIMLSVVPKISTIVSSNRLKNEAKKLKILINKLIIQAASHEKEIKLTIDNNYLVVSFEDNTIMDVVEIDSAIEVTISSPEKNQIVFYKNGVASPSSIKLSNLEKECKITISLRCRNKMICT